MSISPWSAYSNYNSITLTDTFAYYAYLIDMDVTDMSSRIVFDLGKSSVDVVFKEIKLEELSIATSSEYVKNKGLFIYPNPASNKLFFSNTLLNSNVEIFSAGGNKIFSQELYNEQNVDLSGLIPGFYVLKLKSGNLVDSFKFIKK